MVNAVDRPSTMSSMVPGVAAAAAGTGIGTFVGSRNDLGTRRGAGAGLIAGGVIGALAIGGIELASSRGVDRDLSTRVIGGAGMLAAAMATMHLHGAVQLSNPNSIGASFAFVAGAAAAGGIGGAAYHGLCELFS